MLIETCVDKGFITLMYSFMPEVVHVKAGYLGVEQLQ